jgi:predicted dehydrogenase
MMRGVMVGLGNVALNGHLPAYRESGRIQIVGGVDFSPERRKLFQDALPGAPAFASLDECGGLSFDFVDISTPPHTHYPLVKQALEKGLHVLCEKPLVLKEPELSELQALAAKQGRLLMAVHNWKYAPICRKITEVVESGALGTMKHCAWYVLRSGPSVTTEVENWRLDPSRSGGGILIDHGWHAFYLVLEWLKRQPRTVHATLEKRQYENLAVEDTAKVRIEFDADGSPLSSEVFLTWASRLRRNWGVIEGSEAVLQIEDDHLTLSPNDRNKTGETFKFPQGLSQGSHHPDWFGFVIEEFLSELGDADRRGRNLRTARACLSLIERSKESSEKNGAVPYREN